jgi:hypothetical protein
MTPLLFTTGWGLLYLVVLALLMGPALLFKAKRWLAFAMFLLFICDRVAVNLLPPAVALSFLAFAYMLVAVAVVSTHRGTSARIMAAALLVTSIAFVFGSYGSINWDTTGTIQETCGLIAMLAVISRRQNGGTAHAARNTDLAAADRRAAPGAAVARREARK